MPLSITDQAELTSLQTARSLLLSGKLPSKIVYNGVETDYAKIDPARLEARIAQLEAGAALTPFRRARGSVRFRL